MNYNEGISHNKEDLKQEGETYLQLAADGFCRPALLFLEWLYNTPYSEKRSDVETRLEQVNNLQYTRDLNLPTALRYIIDNNIYGTKLFHVQQPSRFSWMRRGNRVADSSLQIDYVKKLEESARLSQGFNVIYYSKVYNGLDGPTQTLRLTLPMSPQNFWWKAANVFSPFLSNIPFGIYQIYYTINDINQHDVNYLTYTISKTPLIPVLTTTLTLYYNIRTWYNSSQVLALSEKDLQDQIRLTALHLASTHPDPSNIAENSEDAISKRIYKAWYHHTKKQPTLSQLALQNAG